MKIIFDVINPTYVRKGFLNFKFLISSILCHAKHFTILIPILANVNVIIFLQMHPTCVVYVRSMHKCLFDLSENEPDMSYFYRNLVSSCSQLLALDLCSWGKMEEEKKKELEGKVQKRQQNKSSS